MVFFTLSSILPFFLTLLISLWVGISASAFSVTSFRSSNISPTTTTEGSATITRTYDERSRLKTFTSADGDLIQYSYDANGNLTKLTYPPDAQHPSGKEVTYTYNARNLLTTVTDWANRTTTYTYDRLGRLTGTIRPNGTANQIAHDNASQLTSIRETANGKLISFLLFKHDPAGQIIRRFRAPLLNSNFKQPAFAATYDNDNRLATLNGQPITHDADGNMTHAILPSSLVSSSLASRVLTYNSRNQLTAAAGLTYTYDAEGRRRTLTDTSGTTRFTTRFTTAPNGDLLVKHNPDGSKTYYIYGLGLIYEASSSGATKTHHYDQVGSTIVRTDDAGKVIGKAEYSAYGLIAYQSGDLATPFLYNGQAGVQTDPNGLLNMRARYYSPYLMRFLNADPIGFSGGSNWFAYADGNPISMSDPFGLCAKSGSGFLEKTWGLAKFTAKAQLENYLAFDQALRNSIGDGLSIAAEIINYPFDALGADPMALGPLGGAEMGMVEGMASLGILIKGAQYADEAAAVAKNADEFVNLASSQRTTHILTGDATGGGHLFPGGAGKSAFPQTWSADRVMHEISDVATDPLSSFVTGRGGRTVVNGTRDGVDIRVILGSQREGGGIITGFPTNVPRNP